MDFKQENKKVWRDHFRERLNLAYAEVGTVWVYKNLRPLKLSGSLPVAICGSIGASIATGKANAVPGDMDFVVKNLNQGLDFVNCLHGILSKYKMYYRVYHNNKTDRCLPGCIHHIRFEAPIWLPICVFIVPSMEYWEIYGRYKIQKPRQIESYRKKMYDDDEWNEVIDNEVEEGRSHTGGGGGRISKLKIEDHPKKMTTAQVIDDLYISKKRFNEV